MGFLGQGAAAETGDPAPHGTVRERNVVATTPGVGRGNIATAAVRETETAIMKASGHITVNAAIVSGPSVTVIDQSVTGRRGSIAAAVAMTVDR